MKNHILPSVELEKGKHNPSSLLSSKQKPFSWKINIFCIVVIIVAVWRNLLFQHQQYQPQPHDRQEEQTDHENEQEKLIIEKQHQRKQKHLQLEKQKEEQEENYEEELEQDVTEAGNEDEGDDEIEEEVVVEEEEVVVEEEEVAEEKEKEGSVQEEGDAEEEGNQIRNGILVLGMHRSGTSLLTGLLVNGFGYHVGGPLIRSGRFNGKGYYELESVVLQNDEFMKKQGMMWNSNIQLLKYNGNMSLQNDDRGQLEFSSLNRALSFFNNASNIPYIQKDPRMCITLKTWLPLLNHQPAIVFTYRHPMEVAQSLMNRSLHLNLQRSLRVWIIYNMRAIQNVKGLCVVYTGNEELLSNPYHEIQRITNEISNKCNVPKPPRQIVQHSFVNEFADRTLQHQNQQGNISNDNGVARFDDEECLVNDFATKSEPGSRRYEVEKKLYLKAMEIFCDFKNGRAYHKEYIWPDNDWFKEKVVFKVKANTTQANNTIFMNNMAEPVVTTTIAIAAAPATTMAMTTKTTEEQQIQQQDEKEQEQGIERTRTGFLVLGMHRSGTSLLTGLLASGLGYHVGGPLFGSGPDNEKGFYELHHVVLQNDAFMNKQGIDWRSNNRLLNYRDDIALQHKDNGKINFHRGNQALSFFNNASNIPYVQKDPRMCITLKTWLPLLNPKPAIVFTYRHPLEVAHSLMKRSSSVNLERSLRIWIIYNMRAIQNIKGLCIINTSYEEIMSNVHHEIQRISNELTAKCDVPKPPRQTLQHDMINGFVDTTLQHHHQEQSNNRTNHRGSDDTKVVIARYHDGECLVYDFETKSEPGSRRYEIEKILYLKAMEIFCDLKNGRAYQDEYGWPNIDWFNTIMVNFDYKRNKANDKLL